MNKFVNNFMASLTEQEKKLPFLTNHARALKAYSELKKGNGVHLVSTSATIASQRRLFR